MVLQTNKDNLPGSFLFSWRILLSITKRLISPFPLQARENGRVPEQTSRHYAKGACGHVCPILLETLTKQSESFTHFYSEI